MLPLRRALGAGGSLLLTLKAFRLSLLSALGSVLLVSVLLASCSSGHRSAAPTSTVPSLPDTTTTLSVPGSASEVASPFDWSRSSSPSLAVGGGHSSTLAALIPPEPGGNWHIYGTETTASGTQTPTVWTSSDGLTWNASPLAGSDLSGSVGGAAFYNGETVVVGSVGAGSSEHAAVWLSAEPGAPFNSVSVSTPAGPSELSTVAAGPLGFFAVGTENGSFAMWSSVSGQQWNLNSGADQAVGTIPGAHVNTLVSIGTTLYAGGSIPDGPTTQAAIWSTQDGLNWNLIGRSSRAFASEGDEEIFSIAALTRGVVAVGAVNFGSGWLPASWISPNGISWSPPSTDFPATSSAAPSSYGPSGGMTVFDVTQVTGSTGEDSLVATGGGPSGQGVWRSTDGLHWSSVDLPAKDASLSDWRATAVGATYSTTVIVDTLPGQPYVLASTLKGWTQPSSNPAVFGPVRPTAVPLALLKVGGELVLDTDVVQPPQSIGPATVSQQTLTSTNATSWSAQTPQSPYPQSLPATNVVTFHSANGWVALGTGSSGLAETWTSTTGTSWHLNGLLQGAAAGATTPTINAVCSSASTPSAQASATSTSSTQNSSTTTSPATTTLPAGTSPPSEAIPAVEVAVGSAPQPSPASTHSSALAPGTQASVWYSTNGKDWAKSTVKPAPTQGGTETVTGCVDIGGSLVAFGTSTAANGGPVPAVWTSDDGVAWSRLAVSGFVAGSPNPIIGMAGHGSYRLAVANPYPAASPNAPGPTSSSAGIGPAASTPTDAGLGSPLGLAPSGSGLWASTDSGHTWRLVATYTSPWSDMQGTQLDSVAFQAGKAVVVGTVEGELAVWVGSLKSGTAGLQAQASP